MTVLRLRALVNGPQQPRYGKHSPSDPCGDPVDVCVEPCRVAHTRENPWAVHTGLPRGNQGQWPPSKTDTERWPACRDGVLHKRLPHALDCVLVAEKLKCLPHEKPTWAPASSIDVPPVFGMWMNASSFAAAGCISASGARAELGSAAPSWVAGTASATRARAILAGCLSGPSLPEKVSSRALPSRRARAT
eukprot:scaffold30_cov66-Phaeocystis_antarctica.AAC.2